MQPLLYDISKYYLEKEWSNKFGKFWVKKAQRDCLLQYFSECGMLTCTDTFQKWGAIAVSELY